MHFKKISPLPPDSAFALMQRYKEDPRSDKVDLGIGIYHDEESLASSYSAIEEAKKIWCRERQEASYKTIEGNLQFAKLLGKMIFSEIDERMVYGQSLGGTGGLYVIGKTLIPYVEKSLYIPDPTWGNHLPIFEKVGYKVEKYPYFSHETKKVFLSGILEKLQQAHVGSVVVFHASCHNPTGTDPSESEWSQILEICHERKLFPIFDLAYAGFGKGREEDCKAVRLFAKSQIEMGVSCSCSKNFGLYRERVGAYFILCKDKEDATALRTHVKTTIRATYSNPPSYGARLVESILSSSELSDIWSKEVEERRKRISSRRKELVDGICLKKGNETYRYLEKQIGMFSYTPLSKIEVDRLIEEDAIYLLQNGRINISGLTEKNLQRVIDGLCKVLP